MERLLALKATEVTGALTEAAALVAEVLEADKVDVFLYDPSIDTLVAVGTSDTPMGRKQHQLGLDRLPLSNGGRTVEVFQTGASYHTGQADADPEVLRGLKGALDIRSMLVAPIQTDGACRGVCEVVCAQPDRFTVEDLRFIESVARWVRLVTQRAELTERLTQAAAEQARRVTADESISVLAHDLRLPLQPLRGHLDLIRMRAERDGRQDYLRHASEAIAAFHRLNRMITDLMDTGRLEQGLFALNVQPMDLAALVRETVDLLRSPEADLQVQAPDELCVEADPDRVRQALENLLSNALRHSPVGAPVVVAVHTDTQDTGEWAVLTVRDEGPGIAPTLLPTLFDRFARASSSSGVGLGLYLARGIADAHGGTLRVESDVGKGTVFHLRLPINAVGR